MEKEIAEVWIGRGPGGATFSKLYFEGEEIESHIYFAGASQENCRDIGKKYAKEMSKRSCFEYAIINGKIPRGYPLPINQDDIDALVTAIGKKFKLVKSD